MVSIRNWHCKMWKTSSSLFTLIILNIVIQMQILFKCKKHAVSIFAKIIKMLYYSLFNLNSSKLIVTFDKKTL